MVTDTRNQLGGKQVTGGSLEEVQDRGVLKDGEFDTSTTTDAPVTASASPSPVMVLTPVFGAAGTASWPSSPNLDTNFDPINPVPPTTTIFMTTSRPPGPAPAMTKQPIGLWQPFGERDLGTYAAHLLGVSPFTQAELV